MLRRKPRRKRRFLPHKKDIHRGDTEEVLVDRFDVGRLVKDDVRVHGDVRSCL